MPLPIHVTTIYVTARIHPLAGGPTDRRSLSIYDQGQINSAGHPCCPNWEVARIYMTREGFQGMINHLHLFNAVTQIMKCLVQIIEGPLHLDFRLIVLHVLNFQSTKCACACGQHSQCIKINSVIWDCTLDLY